MIIIPENLLIEVRIYQYRVPPVVSLPIFPLDNAANETTEWVKDRLLKGVTRIVIFSPQEIQVLRLLRHVREEVDGIKLQPENLVFYFDKPDSHDMVTMYATPDGDLTGNVPGGFFTQRAAELF